MVPRVAALKSTTFFGRRLLEQLALDEVALWNALAMLAGSLGEMIPARTSALAVAVSRVADSVLAVRARLRAGRSCPRRSRQPVGKWSRKGRQSA